MMATGTAIALAALAGTGSSIYSAKKASKTNDKSLDYQREADTRAAATEDAKLAETRREHDDTIAREREEAARKDKLYQDALTRDRERWNDYVRIQSPHWQTGANALGGLYELAGFQGGPPQGGNPASAAMSMGPPSQPSYGGAPPITEPGGRQPTNGGGVIGPQRGGAYGRPTAMPTPTSGLSIDKLMQLAQLAGDGQPPPDGSLSALATMARV